MPALLFARSSVKIQGDTGQKIRQFYPDSSDSWLEIQFQLTDDDKTMHITLTGIAGVPQKRCPVVVFNVTNQI